MSLIKKGSLTGETVAQSLIACYCLDARKLGAIT